MLDLVLRRESEAAAQREIEKLDQRLGRLEGAPQRKPKDAWDVLQIVGAVLSPLILAVLAYILTGKIEIALKQRDLEMRTVKEMQSLISEIVHAPSRDEATPAAVGLAAYGKSAVDPMCSLLRSPRQPVMEAAEEGLRTVGATDPDSVCAAMQRILLNRTRLYSWENKRTAVDLIGQLPCKDGRSELQAFQKVLDGGVDGLKAIAAPNPPVDEAALQTLRDSVQNSMKISGSQEPKR